MKESLTSHPWLEKSTLHWELSLLKTSPFTILRIRRYQMSKYLFCWVLKIPLLLLGHSANGKTQHLYSFVSCIPNILLTNYCCKKFYATARFIILLIPNCFRIFVFFASTVLWVFNLVLSLLTTKLL